MSVVFAYWGVVLIWATTPLGITASNDSLTFWSAAGLRLLAATCLAIMIIMLRRKPLFPHRTAVLSYITAALAFAPQMSLVYWAAQHVTSGVISIIFALSPCLTCLASLLILRDTKIAFYQVLALICAVLGIVVIYADQLTLGEVAVWGMLAVLLSVVIFALGTVVLKKLSQNYVLDPVCQSGGSLLFSLPVFGVMWWVFDGRVPESISTTSLVAVSYLASIGSIVGSSLYFFVMQRMNIVSVSLITLITPILAIGIGVVFWGEHVSATLLMGAVMVLLSLLVFEGIPLKLWRIAEVSFKKRRRHEPLMDVASEAKAP
ncbi:EamA family transporter [Aurantivibrio plasticivorans]